MDFWRLPLPPLSGSEDEATDLAHNAACRSGAQKKFAPPARGGASKCPAEDAPAEKDGVGSHAVSCELERLLDERGEDYFYHHVGPAQRPPIRIRKLPFLSDHVIEFKGGTLWPSGEVLAHFVDLRLAQMLPGRRVIELGAGIVALPGLVAARLGGTVTITDLPGIVGFVERSASENAISASASPLEWGSVEKDDGFTDSFDVVLAADCLYDMTLHDLFFSTFNRVLRSSGIAFVCHQGRGIGDEWFERRLPSEGWEARRLDIRDVFDAMGSNATFRENFDVWACWRCGDDAASCRTLLETACGQRHSAESPGDGGLDDSDDDSLPYAPPEESSSDEDEEAPCIAPAED